MTVFDPGRRVRCGVAVLVGLIGAAAGALAADEPAATRAGLIAEQQAAKALVLAPYEPGRIERFINALEESYFGQPAGWRPFFDSAYSGGGLTLGAGWSTYVSPENLVDLRGSYTVSGYKRIEAEFVAPRLLDRRGRLSVVGGWREATDVGFYGLGTGETSSKSRVHYSFSQPYLAATLDVRPVPRWLVLAGGVEVSTWDQRASKGRTPSVEAVYAAETLPGLGASPTYVHSQARVGVDWRDTPGYTRRGGAYTVTLHDFADRDDRHGFRQVEYEAVQHVPILRDAWVLSFRGLVTTTSTDGRQSVPFFMMPALGGSSNLRGFTSWRFRDRHVVAFSAEWRVLANRFLDMAVFHDAGKAVARRSDLDLDGLKSSTGLGFRFHGPDSTPLRIELAKSNEGLSLVFAATAAF